MARYTQTFETGKTVAEMRSFIDEKMLSRPETRIVISEHRWEGNVLHASGNLGTGTLTLEHGKVIVDIELTAFGSMAQSQIDRVLNDQFKRIGG
jgi:hypothetical protein